MFGVVSLTMGNSALPFAHRLKRHTESCRQLHLRYSAALSQSLYLSSYIHVDLPHVLYCNSTAPPHLPFCFCIYGRKKVHLVCKNKQFF